MREPTRGLATLPGITTSNVHGNGCIMCRPWASNFWRGRITPKSTSMLGFSGSSFLVGWQFAVCLALSIKLIRVLRIARISISNSNLTCATFVLLKPAYFELYSTLSVEDPLNKCWVGMFMTAAGSRLQIFVPLIVLPWCSLHFWARFNNYLALFQPLLYLGAQLCLET